MKTKKPVVKRPLAEAITENIRKIKNRTTVKKPVKKR